MNELIYGVEKNSMGWKYQELKLDLGSDAFMANKIDRWTINKTEEALFVYFGHDALIMGLNIKIEKLNNQVKQIENDIRNNNISISEESKSQTYEERVQTSSDGSSYAEREAIKAVEKLEREKETKKAIIASVNTEIRDIEINSMNMGPIIKKLYDEDHNFLKLKYGDGLSVEEISDKLNISRATGYNKKTKLVNYIANEFINYLDKH